MGLDEVYSRLSCDPKPENRETTNRRRPYIPYHRMLLAQRILEWPILLVFPAKTEKGPEQSPISGSQHCKALNRAWQPLLCFQHLQDACEEWLVNANGNSDHFEEYVKVGYHNEFEVEKIRAEKKNLKCEVEEIIAQCFVSAKSVFKFARWVDKKDPDRLQALPLPDGKKLKLCTARETAELQQFFTGPVSEWTNRADQDVKMGMKRPGGTMVEPCPPTELARDCLYWNPPFLSEEKAVQDTARFKVQKPTLVKIYRNDTDRAEVLGKVS